MLRWSSGPIPAILVRENKPEEAKVAATKISSRPAWYAGLLQACLQPVSPAEMHKLTLAAAPSILGQRDPEFRYYHGSLLAWCGELDTASALIRSAIEQNYCSNTALHSDPALAKLRSAPEFSALASLSKQCHDRFTSATGRR